MLRLHPRTLNYGTWALRCGVLFLLIYFWAAPRYYPLDPASKKSAPPFHLDAPQQVETTDPRVCAHTRLTDEVEDAKILETLRMVREMGASSIVEFLPWAYVEREQGHYEWYHPDRIIEYADNQGLKVIARIGFVPGWARPSDTQSTLNYLPEIEFPSFAKYIGAFAARYKDRVDQIVIWNEPNLNFEWGERPPDPEGYTRLLKMAYEAAHAANPDVMILNAALAPTLAPPGGMNGGWDDLDFLTRMYEAGAGDYFDALAVHTYGFTFPPQADPAPDVLNFRRMELLHEVMTRYGDGDKPVYITETGWNDHPRWLYGIRPAQRINYTLEMLEMTKQYTWLKGICLWVFRFPAPTNRYPDYFTFVSSDFEPKPIYDAVQAYARGWEQPQ